MLQRILDQQERILTELKALHRAESILPELAAQCCQAAQLENPVTEGESESDKNPVDTRGPGPGVGLSDARTARRARWLPFPTEGSIDVPVGNSPCRRWWQLWKPTPRVLGAQ
jgi:hypothetical protein